MIGGLMFATAGTLPASAESAKPDDPNGYGEVVNFGAREDHDVYPDPCNVVGGRRSDIASSGDDVGLSTFVHMIKAIVGSTPSPPGQN
jgi:hypothetical protein